MIQKTILLATLFASIIFTGNAQEVDDIIELDESKIHYQIFGDGVPVLILNGGPGMSSEGFIPLANCPQL